MKIITEQLNESLELPKTLKDYFSNSRIGILDIETTGLSPMDHKLIIGGLLVFDGSKKGTILQYFSENPCDEKKLLEQYLDEVNKCDVLFTYNGKSFDMNFLGIRENKLALPSSRFPYNLDLYLLIRRASDLKNKLPNLKQKSIENYLGLSSQRRDTISGLESIELYQDYIKKGDLKARDKILLHNRDDLYQLFKLIEVVDLCDIEKGFYHFGFPGTHNLHITQTKRALRYLEIHGIQRHIPVSYYSFGDFGESLQIAFDKATETFQIMIPIFQRQGSYFLDLQALNLEDKYLFQDSSYQSGFLIIEDQGQFNYKSINEFTRFLIKKIGKEMENLK